MLENDKWLDALSVIWFLFCWKGYSIYSSKWSKTHPSISTTLDLYRYDWMNNVLRSKNRIADASVAGNLERNGAFFASSSLLIIAGILTAIGYTDEATQIFKDLPWGNVNSELWEIKLGLLMLVFIYSFFKFTWSMRQYNFCAVMISSAPMIDEDKVSPAARKAFARSSAKVANLAGDVFNQGLRSYYFALAVLSWFVHPIMFIFVSAVVVGILYHREFRSRALKALRAGKVFDENLDKAK